MVAIVGHKRGGTGEADIRAGASVRSPTWREIATLNNWTLGRGAQLIPGYDPVYELGSGTNQTFHFRTRPRYQAIERWWWFSLQAKKTDAEVQIDIPATAPVVTETVRLGEVDAVMSVVRMRHALAAQSDTEGELTVKFTSVTGAAYIRGISCVEAPRLNLATATSEWGTDLNGMIRGQPIVEAVNTFQNVVDTNADPTSIGRRVSLVQWATAPVAAAAWNSAAADAGTPTAVFAGNGIPVLMRKDLIADTTDSIKGNVYCWVTGGATGSVRFTSSKHGNGTTRTFTHGAAAWLGTSNLDADFDVDDLSTADGRVGAAWDYMNCDAWISSGTGNLYIAAVSGWED